MNIHGRHISRTEISNFDEVAELYRRPQKHRYIYFIGTKHQKKDMLSALKYPILPYPKGDTQRYDSSAKVETQQLLF